MLKSWMEEWTEGKPLYIEAHFSGSIPVPPELARERVADFLRAHGLPQTFAGMPLLFSGERLAWRVPICLSFPDLGNEEVIHLGSLMWMRSRVNC